MNRQWIPAHPKGPMDFISKYMYMFAYHILLDVQTQKAYQIILIDLKQFIDISNIHNFEK